MDNNKYEYDNPRYRKIVHQEWDADELDFLTFWSELQAFADQYNLSTRYVEEEFLIDGELIPVHLTFEGEDEPV